MSTPIQRLNEAEGTPAADAFMSLLAVEDERFINALEDIAQRRRHDYAKKLSVDGLTHSEVVGHIKDREDDFLEEYDIGAIPEPLMRMEAQDVLMEFIYQRFTEKGLIEEDT